MCGNFQNYVAMRDLLTLHEILVTKYATQMSLRTGREHTGLVEASPHCLLSLRVHIVAERNEPRELI